MALAEGQQLISAIHTEGSDDNLKETEFWSVLKLFSHVNFLSCFLENDILYSAVGDEVVKCLVSFAVLRVQLALFLTPQGFLICVPSLVTQLRQFKIFGQETKQKNLFNHDAN